MRIEKIELIGFKSFADKTTFNFHPGITCIVGPNGCGKSNVVDAFRWVLGEQSAKSLRGEKMEEVIFNGSASKKPKGMAEVTLAISGLNGTQQARQGENGEGSSDTAFVTRRLYRSGDSEYILNKDQCRLKDIKDIFLDTGLEVKSYSVLEQDRIAEILNSKPQDRRFLIEEVAGVMKYNFRKKEAISKLESSKANLQRINDIISEVKKQINLLDRLAKKAERYKKLSSEIHSIELKIAKRDYLSLKEAYDKILAEYTTLKEDESLKKAELAGIENYIETKRLELLEKEKTLENIQTKFQDVEKDISELEKLIAIARTERDNNREYLAKLYEQKEELNLKEEKASLKQKDLEKTETDISSEIERQKEFLADKAGFVRSLEEELADDEESLEAKRREIFKISEDISNRRNDYNSLKTSLEGLKQRETLSVKDAESLKDILSDIDSSLKDLESALLEKNNNLLILKEKREAIANEISEDKVKIGTLREKISGLKEELASNISRFESLRELIFDESTKEILSQDLNITLIASISDVIEIEAKYEKAVESALSEKANSFILPSYNDIKNAISTLKEKETGRTALIPISPVKNIVETDVPEGVIGRASDFIRTKEEFSDVSRSLFGNIFIVKDMQTALNLVPMGHNSVFVTLEGEVIEPSGAVIAGDVRGVFRRKREMRELEKTIENNKTVIADMQEELNLILQMAEKREFDLKDTETDIADIEKSLSILNLTSENQVAEQEQKKRKLASLSIEREQVINEIKLTEKLITEKEAEMQSAESNREGLEQDTLSLQEKIMQKRSCLEKYRAEVTDIRLEITSLKEKLESVRKEREALFRDMANSNQKREFLLAEIFSINSRIEEREKEINIHEEKIRSVVSIADGLKKEISERKELIETENQELLLSEQNLKGIRIQIDSLFQRISELDIHKTEHKMRIEGLHENIMRNYGSDIATIEVEPLSPEDEERLFELKKKIQDLGTVNLGTLEEYEELRTRYEFLTAQQQDLTKSIAELEEAITKINSTTRRKLREAFDLLNAKFSEVFIKLFGGGRAALVMTDENNILDTGIEIIAQPPGKKLQNINLLSGGEKTLTALSLLFASFLIKPTPLCVLDEADSALDEANTGKFAQMIREFSRDTQFIVVTHNRNTMSVADYIYGITMEEPGTSKVISMQLIEAQ
ncbi:MAG: chromosome segregation protein SMC [Nitrospirota bacterium]